MMSTTPSELTVVNPSTNRELASEPCDSDPLIGTVLDGRYLIEARLGEGGMGLVYRARHITLNKALAVKVLRPETAQHPELVERFRREAQSASAIGNPHIVDVMDFGHTTEGAAYFVMEYVDGPALSTLCGHGANDGFRIARIAAQVCTALQAAHDAGIVHRDLKPENIHLVRRDGDEDFVKVLDFGIAKVVGNASKLTNNQHVFGTPHYMAPEQCSAKQATDGRADIYALGVLLFELAAGRVPFEAETPLAILGMHLFEPPPSLAEMVGGASIASELDPIIQRCLAKAPEHRFQSMNALKKALFELYPGLSLALGSAEFSAVHLRPPSKSSAPSPVRKPGGLRWRSALMACAVFVGVLSVSFLHFPAEPQFSLKHVGDAFALASPAKAVFDRGQHDVVDATDAPLPSETSPEQIAEPSITMEDTDTIQLRNIRLSTGARSVRVYQAGQLLGRTPLDVERPPDGQRLALRLRGAGVRTMTVHLDQGSPAELNVRMRRAAALAPEPGSLSDAHHGSDWSRLSTGDELLNPYPLGS